MNRVHNDNLLRGFSTEISSEESKGLLKDERESNWPASQSLPAMPRDKAKGELRLLGDGRSHE